MSWSVEDHELHLLSVLPNGQSGDAYRAGQVQVTADADGRLLPPWQRWWRPLSDVVAFAAVCDCTVAPAPAPAGGAVWRTKRTRLARWERVQDPHLEDLCAGRVYAAGDVSAMDLSDRRDVEEHLLQLWAQHRAPQEATSAIESAWAHSRNALSALDEAVAAGREVGLSWADIGRATGMTRQSARERWS
ncbi:hypothetical protein [Kineococcus arenarius]|uniref:hypothetical protein n=1 Tax=Kineococcus sp. SYSU DK007 TaxID=3383128 RepID=UPI003D7CDADF